MHLVDTSSVDSFVLRIGAMVPATPSHPLLEVVPNTRASR